MTSPASNLIYRTRCWRILQSDSLYGKRCFLRFDLFSRCINDSPEEAATMKFSQPELTTSPNFIHFTLDFHAACAAHRAPPAYSRTAAVRRRATAARGRRRRWRCSRRRGRRRGERRRGERRTAAAHGGRAAECDGDQGSAFFHRRLGVGSDRGRKLD